MRKTFAKTLEELMAKDNSVWLLYIDLGFNFLEDIQKKFPERCINTGVIEQSAIGIACGLALAGKKPYVYSASNFLIFRAFEFVRNDVAYQNLDVKLVGFAGQSYNFLGYSHLPKNKEDVAMLKKLPNIKIYEPVTPDKVRLAVLESYTHGQPSYIRLK